MTWKMCKKVDECSISIDATCSSCPCTWVQGHISDGDLWDQGRHLLKNLTCSFSDESKNCRLSRVNQWAPGLWVLGTHIFQVYCVPIQLGTDNVWTTCWLDLCPRGLDDTNTTSWDLQYHFFRDQNSVPWPLFVTRIPKCLWWTSVPCFPPRPKWTKTPHNQVFKFWPHHAQNTTRPKTGWRTWCTYLSKRIPFQKSKFQRLTDILIISSWHSDPVVPESDCCGRVVPGVRK